MVLHFNLWVAKRQQHSRSMEFPPSITIVSCPRPVFSQEGYQNNSEVCGFATQRVCTTAEVSYLQTLRNHVRKDCVCGISRSLYGVIMLVAAWSWICRAGTAMTSAEFSSKRSCSTVVSEDLMEIKLALLFSSPQETPVYIHKNDALPSCDEKCPKILVCKCLVYEARVQVFRIPLCPFVRNILTSNASKCDRIDWWSKEVNLDKKLPSYGVLKRVE